MCKTSGIFYLPTENQDGVGCVGFVVAPKEVFRLKDGIREITRGIPKLQYAKYGNKKGAHIVRALCLTSGLVLFDDRNFNFCRNVFIEFNFGTVHSDVFDVVL